MKRMTSRFAGWVTVFLLMTGCGGGGGGEVSSVEKETDSGRSVRYAVASADEASAFLSRATFGATPEEIDRLVRLGDYDLWLQEQFREPPSYHMAWAEERAEGVGGVGDLKDHPEDWKRFSDALGYLQRDAWWDIAVHGRDQLRQRVAFALSEILVISRNGPLLTYPDARISYYDVLVRHAFDSYEELLKAVTYHPAMGKYLSYLGNAKAGTRGAHPDENYAREVMQLFSIGLYRLDRDGRRLLRDGRPQPVYDQKDIEQMAKIFTGLTDDNGQFETEASFSSHHARTSAMVAVEEYHDRSEKRLFSEGRLVPAGGDTKGDIDKALHMLATHPNTAPFVSRRLIQRLVTSNPSPAYVERVAEVFEDNGKGERGDLGAVVRAILLDDEALHGARNRPEIFGKFREPLLYFTHLFRAFHAQDGYHILRQGDTPLYRYRSFNFNGTGYTRQEGPLEALTVFNYFTPEDAPYTLKKEGIAAPELELYGKQGIDEVLMGIIHKNDSIYGLFEISADLQLEKESALASGKRYGELLDRLDRILTAGHLSASTREAILSYARAHASDEGMSGEKMARHMLGLVITSPDYALQR
jgi:hypothetical protein